MSRLEEYIKRIKKGLQRNHVELECPAAYYNGKMVLFEECHDQAASHAFGGDLPAIRNAPSNAILHLVLDINPSLSSLFDEVRLPAIPLVFPFRHDGGRIEYRVDANGGIEIERLQPEEAEPEWPYSNYPEIFPVKRFCCSEPIDIKREQFERMVPQGLWQEDPCEIVVVVPPSQEYGISMWGPEGDDEGVVCFFYINSKSGTVCAGNQCW